MDKIYNYIEVNNCGYAMYVDLYILSTTFKDETVTRTHFTCMSFFLHTTCCQILTNSTHPDAIDGLHTPSGEHQLCSVHSQDQ